jgi:predicted nucleotidyltransferase
MADFIEAKNEEIAAACLQLGIKKLFVFGSALRDDFRSGESDIDLLAAFRKIFHADVDLVMQDAEKNKIISREIDRTKRLVYGS